jgi:hypothetical protein
VQPVETLFRTLSSVRRDRIFHPQGRVFEGTWRIDREDARVRGAQAFRAGFEAPAIVRLSRGAGVAEWLPDIFGAAVRLPDAYGEGRHQDLLVNTTIDLPFVHHLFVPTTGWFAAPKTTSLPYRAGEGPLVLLGLLPPDEPEPGVSLDALEARIAARPVDWGIAVSSLEGRFSRVGTLRVQRRRSELDTTRFDPFTTGGGLRPAGIFNRLRKAAYRGSRSGAPVAD